ncbi:MAG: DUF2510 domain-containing protein [Ilumatobacter sp.]|uniref:DUF2510 domain-containing protein n=1 Tax=Ilumatobacter sp. TaxID=1967498 RepID=UPI003297B444
MIPNQMGAKPSAELQERWYAKLANIAADPDYSRSVEAAISSGRCNPADVGRIGRVTAELFRRSPGAVPLFTTFPERSDSYAPTAEDCRWIAAEIDKASRTVETLRHATDLFHVARTAAAFTNDVVGTETLVTICFAAAAAGGKTSGEYLQEAAGYAISVGLRPKRLRELLAMTLEDGTGIRPQSTAEPARRSPPPSNHALPEAAQRSTPPQKVERAMPEGWYADSFGRFELRFWDGLAWTEHVSRMGQQYTDAPVTYFETVAAADDLGEFGVPEGWYADSSGRFELRFWDGLAWTEHVFRMGQQYTDAPVRYVFTVAAADESSESGVPKGWYADPSGRFEVRFWDGLAWTEHVSRVGQQYTDPPII